MKYIYLINYCNGTPSSNYATNEKGIKGLALEWYWTGWEGEKCPVTITLDMEAMTILVKDSLPGLDEITYDILKFVRES